MPSNPFPTLFQPADFLEPFKISSHKVTIWTKDLQHENRKSHSHDYAMKNLQKMSTLLTYQQTLLFIKCLLGSRLVVEKYHVSLPEYFKIKGRIDNIKKEVKQ